MDAIASLANVEQKPGMVLDEHGNVRAVMVQEEGQTEYFKCECGCQYFHKYTDAPNEFICNACGVLYRAEADE